VLIRKLWRDFKGQKWQIVAVVIVVLLGISLFDASYLAYQNLQRSYSATEQRTHMADMTVQVTSISPEQTAAVRDIPGVATAISQLVQPFPVIVLHGRTEEKATARIEAQGRFISIPLHEQPKLNQVVVISGHYPTSDNEVLVERHFAEYQHLEPGNTFLIETPAGSRVFQVAGIAVSPDYLWVARNRQDIFPSPADFGVFFIPRQGLTSIGRAAIHVQGHRASMQLQLAATGTDGNTLLYSLTPGANSAQVLSRVKSVLGAQNVLSATPRKDEVGAQLLQMDLNGFQEMAGAFPLFFLIVAAFIVAALMNRMVNRERPLIGTMMALGVRRRTILGHYLSMALTIGVVGSTVGTVAGLAMGNFMTTEYANELHIPFVSVEVNFAVLLAGVAMGLLAPLLAGLLPAIRASQLQPAEAMRPFVSQPTLPLQKLRNIWQPQWNKIPRQPNQHGNRRRNWVPFWLRLTLRDVARRPGRTAATAIGIMAALALVVTTAGLKDSMTRGINLSFTQSVHYDLRADFYSPQSAPSAVDEAHGIPGVTNVETITTLPVEVANLATGKTYDTSLQGLPPESPLLQLRSSGGTLLAPEPGKAIVSSSIATKLGLKVGDKIRVKVLPSGRSIILPIQALDFSVIGNSVTLASASVATDFHMTGKATTLLLKVSPGKTVAVRVALEKLPTVVQVQDEQAFRSQVQQLMGLMNVLLAMMLMFAVILAAAILFNTATLNVLERQREFATMRALGYPLGGIVGLVTASNGIIGVIGLILGFPVALLVLRQFLNLYTSDLFTMPFWLYPETIAISIIGVLLVLFLAQWPALGAVRRMNLAEASKMRE